MKNILLSPIEIKEKNFCYFMLYVGLLGLLRSKILTLSEIDSPTFLFIMSEIDSPISSHNRKCVVILTID